jgi:hypothetical protein
MSFWFHEDGVVKIKQGKSFVKIEVFDKEEYTQWVKIKKKGKQLYAVPASKDVKGTHSMRKTKLHPRLRIMVYGEITKDTRNHLYVKVGQFFDKEVR